MVNVVAELAELLGPHRVGSHPADLHRHASDRSASALLARRAGRKYALPLCIVRPHNTEQVADVLKWADATKTPVVPYGGGSAVVESIVGGGAVVIELRALNEILDFDEKSRLVRTQTGVMGPDLIEALTSWGFTLGHEPQSVEISTVGGWIATRASGQLSSAYGGIESMVAGLEAVLPGGRIVRSKPVPRRAAGPDVASLMIGSEGTLGIVTEATLRVSPLPVERADRCVRFDHMADGVAAARALAQSQLKPALVRLYDKEDATIFLRNHPEEEISSLLLMSFEGEGAESRAKRAVDLSGGRTGNDALVAHWWAHRNDAVDEYTKLMAGEGILGPHALVDTLEVAGSWTVLRDLYHSMKEALGMVADVVGCHLSHIYPDGACLYFTIASACADDDAAFDALERWWGTGMNTCLEAGGTISHHHGIGRRKAKWLDQELGGWLEILAAVKSAIDPNGIMNPGALGL
ncbi:MAG: alkyldihydroxyacetonephosphate synthase [Actinomycetota bacterium]|nr:alkyldihydroxyacetonephosphate synthase [Actinomycetota bacterium]